MTPIRIGTRGSALALAQAHWVRKELLACHSGLAIELVTIKTSGDRSIDLPTPVLGGKGIFIKEIEEALLNRDVDLAVHSMKDLPAENRAGLIIAAIPEREDARDVLVSHRRRLLKDLPYGSRIGTGSLRRQVQIRHYRGDLLLAPLRGNVDTRLKKLERGECDALVLAAAGLKRIGQEDKIAEYLAPEICLSAGAQGALAIQCREGDPAADLTAPLHHPPSAFEVLSERAFLERLGGGCALPVAVRGELEGDRLRLVGLIAEPDGERLVRDAMTGVKEKGTEMGRALAEKILASGGREILAALSN